MTQTLEEEWNVIVSLRFDSGQVAGYNLSIDTVSFGTDVECFSEVTDGGGVELMDFNVLHGLEGM